MRTDNLIIMPVSADCKRHCEKNIKLVYFVTSLIFFFMEYAQYCPLFEKTLYKYNYRLYYIHEVKNHALKKTQTAAP